MTVSSTISRKSYVGAGSTGPYPITFAILEDTHLSVTRVVDATGAETALTLDAGTDGFTIDSLLTEITTTEAVASGETLVLLRDVPLLQGIDYIANNVFPAEANEQGLDKLTHITQQINEALDRAVLLPAVSSVTGITIPEPEADLFIAWNTAADALINTVGLEGPTGPTGPAGADGEMAGPGISVDKELALFDGITGEVLERATGTGFVKVTSGVMDTPVTTVDTAEIADNAITLGKMAGGTDGNLITYDASGDPAYVATGTATHVLTSNGAGAAPTFQAAAGGGTITTTTISNDATIDFTSLNFDDNEYEFIITGVDPVTDNTDFEIVLSEDNFSSSDNPVVNAAGQNAGGNYFISGASNTLSKLVSNAETTPDDLLHGIVQLSQLTSAVPLVGTYSTSHRNAGNSGFVQLTGDISSSAAPTTYFNAVRFKMSSGNLNTGTITMIAKPRS